MAVVNDWIRCIRLLCSSGSLSSSAWSCAPIPGRVPAACRSATCCRASAALRPGPPLVPHTTEHDVSNQPLLRFLGEGSLPRFAPQPHSIIPKHLCSSTLIRAGGVPSVPDVRFSKMSWWKMARPQLLLGTNTDLPHCRCEGRSQAATAETRQEHEH